VGDCPHPAADGHDKFRKGNIDSAQRGFYNLEVQRVEDFEN
jgi:hypothetical protein